MALATQPLSRVDGWVGVSTTWAFDWLLRPQRYEIDPTEDLLSLRSTPAVVPAAHRKPTAWLLLPVHADTHWVRISSSPISLFLSLSLSLSFSRELFSSPFLSRVLFLSPSLHVAFSCTLPLPALLMLAACNCRCWLLRTSHHPPSSSWTRCKVTMQSELCVTSVEWQHGCITAIQQRTWAVTRCATGIHA